MSNDLKVLNIVVIKIQAQDSLIEIEFYDSAWNKVSTRDSAKNFYRIEYANSDKNKAVCFAYSMDSVLLSTREFANYPKSELHGVSRFFYKNGTTKYEANYLNGSMEGIKTKYFEDGKVKMTLVYSMGELDGTCKVYTPLGELLREEKFVSGYSRKEKCFLVKDTTAKCNPISQQASFPGGDNAFLTYLADNIKYPKELQRKGLEGEVVMRFAIGKGGSVERISARSEAHALIIDEVTRVLEKSPKWIPAYFEGEPITAWRQVPVNLRLN